MQTIELTVKVRDSKETVKQKLIENGFNSVKEMRKILKKNTNYKNINKTLMLSLSNV